MRPFLIRLGIAFALTMPGVARAATDNSFLASMASAVASATKIEALRLSCRDTLSSGVTVIGGQRVIGQAADLDSLARVRLVTILEAASSDTADCIDYRCTYCPAYRLVIRDREPPIELVVTQGCITWGFRRGEKSLHTPGSCGAVPSQLLEPLRALLEQVYARPRGAD